MLLLWGTVVAYLPSPLEVPAVKGSEVDNPDAPLTRKPADEEPFSALAFKIMADQFVGSLTFLRIYRCACCFQTSPGSGPSIFSCKSSSGPHSLWHHGGSLHRSAVEAHSYCF